MASSPAASSAAADDLMISHFSPVDLANIPLPPIPPLPPLPPVAAALSAVADDDEADDVSAAVRDNLNDEVQPAVAWGEPDAHFFTEEGVQAIANRLDRQNKKTRLNDKSSLWRGLIAMTEGVAGLEELDGKDYKISPNVVANETLNGALSNALNFGMMPAEEQKEERARYHAADKSPKKCGRTQLTGFIATVLRHLLPGVVRLLSRIHLLHRSLSLDHVRQFGPC